MTVRDNPTDNRYNIYDDDDLAGFTAFELTSDQITFTHTEKQLVTEAFDNVRGRGLTFLPVCPYVRRFISRNTTAYLDLVPENDRERLGLISATY